MSEEQVRQELREIRYFYSRKKNMEALFAETGVTQVKALAEKYANAIRTAPARLFDLYGCLYIQNKTQEAVAIELCYSPEYIRRLTKELANCRHRTVISSILFTGAGIDGRIRGAY